MESLRAELESGPLPRGDAWGGVYTLLNWLAQPGSGLRRLICAHFWPKQLELADNGRVYRRLGVSLFGRIIPTGGIEVRRLTRSKMTPYTLRATTVRAARDFYYRTCIFEALHTPFMLALLVITGHQLAAGRHDLALQDMLVNLGINIYPMMHHRHTRVRIVRLLQKANHRAAGPNP